MKILYLHRTQGAGVEGVHIWGIVNGFKSLGHEVKVFSPAGMQEREVEKTPQTLDRTPRQPVFSYISRNVPELIFEVFEIGYNFIALFGLYAQLKKFKPDIIYERYAIFNVSGKLLSKYLKIPHVLEINFTSDSPLVRQRSKFLMPLARIVDRQLFNSATRLIAVSSYLKNHLQSAYGIDEHKLVICPNAVDLKVFDHKTPTHEKLRTFLSDKKEVIGFVGSFAPWHGLDLFIDAFKIVAENRKDCVAILIGDGPQRDAIVEKVKQFGLGQRVLFTGTVEHADLPAYIASFTLGIMPDSNEYGSPMKIFEYMALRKPVVVPDYGPLCDVIEHSVNGYLFKKRNMTDLAAIIMSALDDKDELHQVGQRARTCIEEKHNWKANAEVSLCNL